SDKKPMVNYWLHTGFLMVGGEKMAKSLGNFVTIRDMLEDYDPEVLRFFFASTHYRSPIDYTENSLQQAKNSLDTLYTALDNLKELQIKEDGEPSEEEKELRKQLQETERRFLSAMDDDFNAPLAISHLFDLSREINLFAAQELEINGGLLTEIFNTFRELGGLLGILQREQEPVEEELVEELVEMMIELRDELRKRKDFATSDRIRAELRRLGIVLEDTPKGIRWRRR
ncbi:class I tRNA ligase family protein, partial [Candidatus Bathyarchaeota archaeon]|nr:class I tRNA ligase family protein [Candidatus Bathyarchaeota archaeon]NIR15268.1 class I tRNA ligase family protein [Desulfobacterales bacterium]NIU81207.1 class I tRNA ligase family protein [Candidatus Bathyarchaeota archaeon]NIV67854.1 class I tRNA ligase family protein [Candidatus Bathyarchaeota archaeon]NIW16314.1 class I tRNA ligase family protein [Candidatus Bathyarchaeota archaeon]